MNKTGASTLDKYIFIEAPAMAYNEALERDEPKTDPEKGTPIYEVFYEGFANFKPSLGGESFDNEIGQTAAKSRATFRIWDSPQARGVKEKMRVKFLGFDYEILSAEPTGDLRYIDILTEKRT